MIVVLSVLVSGTLLPDTWMHDCDHASATHKPHADHEDHGDGCCVCLCHGGAYALIPVEFDHYMLCEELAQHSHHSFFPSHRPTALERPPRLLS